MFCGKVMKLQKQWANVHCFMSAATRTQTCSLRNMRPQDWPLSSCNPLNWDRVKAIKYIKGLFRCVKSNFLWSFASSFSPEVYLNDRDSEQAESFTQKLLISFISFTNVASFCDASLSEVTHTSPNQAVCFILFACFISKLHEAEGKYIK